MLALIAGTGGLPTALVARLPQRPVICALDGFVPDMPVDVTFRIEHLGTFLDQIKRMGVTGICLAGGVRRPQIDPAAIDAATAPLVPRIAQAISQGDDGALRIIIAIFEEWGFVVRAAHELAPDLLPPSGVPTQAQPQPWHHADARVGDGCISHIGAADQGQACIVRVSRVEAVEDALGTEAMISLFQNNNGYRPFADDPLGYFTGLAGDALGSAAEWLSGDEAVPVAADDGILFKAPKPGQDRRADLPLIGPDTAMQCAAAGLAGIVIEAGGVMVLDPERVIRILDEKSMFLWVRERGGA